MVVEVSDKVHIDAYLSSGWKPLVEKAATVNPTTQSTTITKTQK